MIVIGLGNPGAKYASHRHNVGCMVLDALASAYELVFEKKSVFDASVSGWEGLVLAKPDTFMNESGKAAAKLHKQYPELPIVVVYDDVDIPIGEVKCSFARGAGGHNGVQSVIDHLGTKDFFRIRVGVRPVHEELVPRIAPPNGFETYLLSDFAPFEAELKAQGIEKALSIIKLLPTSTFEEIMNQYN